MTAVLKTSALMAIVPAVLVNGLGVTALGLLIVILYGLSGVARGEGCFRQRC